MRLVCLANSLRPDGRCVAGIDRETGKWIRPVPRIGDAIPEIRCHSGGRYLSLLHLVEIDLVRPQLTPKYQNENRVIQKWNWAIVGILQKTALEQYVEAHAPILHSGNDRVDPKILELMPPSEWKSLQLVRPKKLCFEPDPWTPHRWRARFRDSAGNEYCLKITDPEATRRLEIGGKIDPSCLLTVSLTKPWSPDPKKPAMCYKLVAAVIEL